ncbi:uncharacterized protein RHIMIDRAFT_233467 [Rhizopus microsporus ATCC 52813]|uniref:Uncharacterized protein n=1 Tax=Rhizopus microsporus ATCC 52813 TaxID=1340429 RepID=A0A2G4T4D4_RHIZD|nr:uncharacterized protein RHIMIDRAFT_233467 [Rhizopus microsporus ATCC 52813]PHZ15858.1 hypothetical protein RHIMIDRAFT_233467 [Rhizopus microsporus ATCC 52813]
MATSDNLNVLSQRYQELRQISRSSGRDYDEKYQVMKALGDQLGLPGTPAAEILSKFGKPDEMTPSLGQGQASVAMMPGPVIPGSVTASSGEGSGQPPYYFVYYLIPKKEYLYFKVGSILYNLRKANFVA